MFNMPESSKVKNCETERIIKWLAQQDLPEEMVGKTNQSCECESGILEFISAPPPVMLVQAIAIPPVPWILLAQAFVSHFVTSMLLEHRLQLNTKVARSEAFEINQLAGKISIGFSKVWTSQSSFVPSSQTKQAKSTGSSIAVIG
ncbi:hypothetical protein BH10CYA1_BH10CYA1_40680 [soil metagenome]